MTRIFYSFHNTVNTFLQHNCNDHRGIGVISIATERLLSFAISQTALSTTSTGRRRFTTLSHDTASLMAVLSTSHQQLMLSLTISTFHTYMLPLNMSITSPMEVKKNTFNANTRGIHLNHIKTYTSLNSVVNNNKREFTSCT
jgi:hypothetical protein